MSGVMRFLGGSRHEEQQQQLEKRDYCEITLDSALLGFELAKFTKMKDDCMARNALV